MRTLTHTLTHRKGHTRMTSFVAFIWNLVIQVVLSFLRVSVTPNFSSSSCSNKVKLQGNKIHIYCSHETINSVENYFFTDFVWSDSICINTLQRQDGGRSLRGPWLEGAGWLELNVYGIWLTEFKVWSAHLPSCQNSTHHLVAAISKRRGPLFEKALTLNIY